MADLVLRPYQSDLQDAIRNSIRAGKRSPVVQLPTGGGKTAIMSDMIRSAVKKGKKVLALAPRRELIFQMHKSLAKCGVHAGIIMANVKPMLFLDVQVASFDTLHARAVRKQKIAIPAFNMVIVDEAHLSISKTRQDIIDMFPNAILIGFTATPARGDGRGLIEVYDDLVLGPSVAELTDMGWLVPARYYAPTKPDLAHIKLNADGDYMESQLGPVMDKPQLVGDIIDNWIRIASTRRTVVFCTNVKHSIHVCEHFCRIGVKAEHLDGETDLTLREEILARVKSGETQVLCNVFVASYGLDIPELDCAVLARPTKNITLYLQTVGRVLRPAPGKVDALIIDHAGSVAENGFADEFVPWSLDGKESVKDRKERLQKEGKEPKQITCPKCSAAFSGRRICPSCGHELIKEGKPIPCHEATLTEIDRDPKKENKEASWPEKMSFIAQLRGYAQEKGKADGWVAHKYRARFGVWPNDERVRHQSANNCGINVRNWIKSQNIRYAKSMEKTHAHA